MDPPNFAALDIDRAGTKVNLIGHLTDHKVLLAVDNFSTSRDAQARFIAAFDEFASDSCGLAMTTQSANVNLPYTVPIGEGLSCAETISLLPCPEEVSRNIYAHTKGYPLVVQIIRGLLRDGISTCRTILQEIGPLHNLETEGQTLVQRLMVRHTDVLRSELKILRWLDRRLLDRHLVRQLLKVSGVDKLLSRSFMIEYGEQTYAIHDVVFDCIRASVELDQTATSVIERDFFRYIEAHLMERPYHLIRNLYTFEERVAKSAFQVAQVGIEVRALLELKPKQTAEYDELLQKICDAHFDSSWGWVEVTSVVEAMETRINLCAKGSERKNLAAAFAARLTAARPLFSQADLRIRSALDLHAGKLYLWAGDSDTAKHHLEQALVSEPGLLQAHLQLARVLSDKDPGVARAHLEEILKASSAGDAERSVTTVLAAYAELKKSCFKELRDRYLFSEPGPFLKTIRTALMTGSPQPLNTMAELVGSLGYVEPELALQILTDVDLPEPPANDASQNKSFGRILLGKYKALMELNEAVAAESAARDAIRYIERAGEPVSSFDKTALAKAYFAVTEFDRALTLLYTIPLDRRDAFAWLEIAKCEQARSRLNEAKDAIDEGLRALDLGSNFRATFLERRGQILVDLKAYGEAVQAFKEALSCGPEPKHALQIQSRIDGCENVKDP